MGRTWALYQTDYFLVTDVLATSAGVRQPLDGAILSMRRFERPRFAPDPLVAGETYTLRFRPTTDAETDLLTRKCAVVKGAELEVMRKDAGEE